MAGNEQTSLASLRESGRFVDEETDAMAERVSKAAFKAGGAVNDVSCRLITVCAICAGLNRRKTGKLSLKNSIVKSLHFGIGLSDVTIPESWCYIKAEDAWCSNHNDAFFPGVPTITAVEDDGHFITIRYTIEGYWVPGTETFLDTAPLVLSLTRNEDGTIHAVSNLLES